VCTLPLFTSYRPMLTSSLGLFSVEMAEKRSKRSDYALTLRDSNLPTTLSRRVLNCSILCS